MFDDPYRQMLDPHRQTGGVAPGRAEIARRHYLEKVRQRQEAERRVTGPSAARLANRIAALIGTVLSRALSLKVTRAPRSVQPRTR